RALGAGRVRVAREVVARVGFLTAVGVALGAAGAVVGGRFLSSLFVGAEPTDPWVLVRVAVLLALVALSASIGPVWRALGILPTEALRRS
ncbi:MAG TPA: hypothetical protein VLL48_03710, partial [Longimicrobiales bacterium]|nr:hypothetical protein [Longimicrobiales bacterium]